MSLYAICNSCVDGRSSDKKRVSVGLKKEDFEVDLLDVYYVGKVILLKIPNYEKTNKPMISDLPSNGTRRTMFRSSEPRGIWVNVPLDSLVTERELERLRAINY